MVGHDEFELAIRHEQQRFAVEAGHGEPYILVSCFRDDGVAWLQLVDNQLVDGFLCQFVVADDAEADVALRRRNGFLHAFQADQILRLQKAGK